MKLILVLFIFSFLVAGCATQNTAASDANDSVPDNNRFLPPVQNVSADKNAGAEPAVIEPVVTESKAYLSDCLASIDANTLPKAISGFSGKAIPTTKPFDWTGPDGIKTAMDSQGYIANYTSGEKSVNAIVQKIKNNSNFEKILSDTAKVKAGDVNKVITKKELKSADVYVFGYPDKNQFSWFIYSGNNVYSYFGFTRSSYPDSERFVNDWAGQICAG